MATPRLDRPRAIKILVDAEQLGDPKTRKKWGVTQQTLRNYRERLQNDPELLREFARVHAAADQGWKNARRMFLKSAIQKLESLIQEAGVEQLTAISQAIERVGKLDVASEALGVGTSTDQRSDSAQEPEGSGPEGTAEGDAGLQRAESDSVYPPGLAPS